MKNLFQRLFDGKHWLSDTAIESSQRSLSYRELDAEVSALVLDLSEHVHSDEATIAIAIDSSVDYVVAMLATLKLGKAFIPLGAAYPPERLHKVLQATGCRAILTLANNQASFDGDVWSAVSHISSAHSELCLLRCNNKADASISSLPDDLAYVLSTSGSTGEPKLIMGSAEGLAHFVHWQVEHFTIDKHHRFSGLSPVTFDVSLRDMLVPLVAGGVLCLPEPGIKLEPLKLMQWLIDTRITSIHCVPTLFRALCLAIEQTQVDNTFSSIKRIWLAGEPLYRADIERWQALGGPLEPLVNFYGPSETTLAKLFCHIALVFDQPWSIAPLGQPMADTSVAVLNEQGHPVALGETGELCIGTAFASHGYLGQPALNEAVFFHYDHDGFSGRWYKTGDLVHQDAQNRIHFHSRKDHQIKLNGQRIEINEVESALNRADVIEQSAVLVTGELGQQALAACVVLTNKQSLKVDELRAFLADHIPDYMIPATYHTVSSLPTNNNGKLNRKALPELLSSVRTRPELSQQFVAPKSPSERAIASIWQEALHIDRLGIEDNFFDLGGTSLLAMQVIPEINQALSSDISIAQFFNLATVSALAKRADDGHQAKPASQAWTAKPRRSEQRDVAIIGFACRVPGADDVDEFWQNLVDGKETITFFTDDELHHSVDEELKANTHYVKARGTINHHHCFDHEFFGLSSREADILDPQQRVLIELSHTAIEHASIDRASLKQGIGVFAGVGDNGYFTRNLLNHSVATDLGEHRLRLANEKDYVAPRIAYCLDTQGPAVSIHTACSTSLVAIAQGVQSVRDGHTAVALCGGAFIPCPQNTGYLHAEGGFASADGHCRPFDADASGTVFSAGAGMVVLRLLDEAQAAGDTIYGVIKGVGINNDGGGKMSFMAPSSEGQSQAIARAIADANIASDSIDFIEAHGTATPLGDPIELEGLSQVYLPTDKSRLIGSVKSNIGHTDAAAGVMGLIKATLSLHHKQLPASLGYQTPNPSIDFNSLGFSVNQELTVLTERDTPYRCGISAFGVGGTNAHVVLEQYVTDASTQADKVPIVGELPDRSTQLLLFSAKSEASCRSAIDQACDRIHSEVLCKQWAYTQAFKTQHYAKRAILISNTASGAALEADDAELSTVAVTHAPSVVFMFPGQGAQSVGMTWQLYQQEPLYRETIDECASILHPILNGDIRGLLFPTKFADEANAFLTAHALEPGDEALAQLMNQTQYAQPALFVVGLALAQWFIALGVTPKALIGHSIGEFAAAYLAGVFTLDQALKLVADRGRIMQAQAPGAMVAVSLDNTELEAAINTLSIESDCALAAINAPGRTVASGTFDAIDLLVKHLDANDIAHSRLSTSHAFHSPMMNDAANKFIDCFKALSLKPPSTPIMSTSTGQWLTDSQATDPQYWANHLRDPVRFATAVQALWQKDDYLLLELGPKGGAAFLARQSSQHPLKQVALASLSRDSDEDAFSLVACVGRLWMKGVSINWCEFYRDREQNLCALPTYAFKRDQHWLEPQYQRQRSSTDPVDDPSTRQEIPSGSSIDTRLRAMIGEMTGFTIDSSVEHMHFFELGLDSLSMTQFVIAIKRQFDVDVSLRELTSSCSTTLTLLEHLEQNSERDCSEETLADVGTHNILINDAPPIAGAQLGRDPSGNPGWYIADPDRPSSFLKLQISM